VSLYAAGRGFLQLQAVLNDLWGVRVSKRLTLLQLVRRRVLAFASVALCGALLIASLTLSVVLHSLTDRVTHELELSLLALRLIEELSSFSLVSLLLIVVYRTLPDVKVRWDDVVVGAFVSAALFVVGKHAVSFYLRTFGATSTFGAAGALVALMVYVRYTAQVMLFGAEFTFVFARWRGHPIQPTPGAVVDHPPGEHHL
jgi:membrane protein